VHVLVAGATGAIGIRAVTRMIEAGHEVSGLARSASATERLVSVGARPVLAGLGDVAALQAAMAGHDAVVNLATHVPPLRSAALGWAWRQDDWIRTEGSRLLGVSALAAGVGRLVQESVTFLYADGGAELITEQSALAPNPRSQRAVMAAAANAQRFVAAGRTAVILRFGQVYGPDRNSAELLGRVRAGRPAVLGTPDGWLTPLHADDAAAAVLAALHCEGGTYNVGEEPVRRSSWSAALGCAAAGPGGRPARFYPPLAQRLAGPRAEPLRRSLRVSSESFQAATGWRPAFGCTQDGWSGQTMSWAG
jgi:nucleoside-diphosphate-sugar epimerase